MTDIWFYHLTQKPLEKVLPGLLEKSRERGWTCVVQASSEARLAALDDALWVYSEESFLPHGRAGEVDGARQPVLLTLAADNPNKAAIRFLVEGADAQAALQAPGGQDYKRCVILFDGNDMQQLEGARAQWAALKRSGHAVTYWQQEETGRWEKKA